MKVFKGIIGTFAIIFGIILAFGLFAPNEIDIGIYMRLIQPLMPFMCIIIGIGFFRKNRMSEKNGLIYAEVPRRAFAIFIDVILIIVPFALFQRLLLSGPLFIYAIFNSIIGITIQGMYLYFLTSFGATPGKMVAGIKVIKSNGSNVNLKDALLRSVVDIFFGLLSSIAMIITLFSFSYSEYQNLGWAQGSKYLMDNYPFWYLITLAIQQYWMWSEIVVMMFNPQRKAVHDFIADTIVVVKDSIDPNRINNEIIKNPSQL